MAKRKKRSSENVEVKHLRTLARAIDRTGNSVDALIRKYQVSQNKVYAGEDSTTASYRFSYYQNLIHVLERARHKLTDAVIDIERALP